MPNLVAEPTSAIALTLALALAEKLDDLPSAIARATAIPIEAPEAAMARGLEGRWRASLGDVVGAGLAFARLRDLAGALPVSARESRTRSIVALLVEAARMESEVRRDPDAARRHLAAALRLSPRDPALRRLYRQACSPLSEPTAEGRDSEATEASAQRPLPSLGTETLLEPVASDEDLERHARVEELTRRVHADPNDAAVTDELIDLLEQLRRSRGHELLALLSAGLADADEARRAVLAPRARATLGRLADQADSAGRSEEAALYREAVVALTR